MAGERITVIGNVGQEPRRKTTSRGDVLEFSLAHNLRVQAPDGTWTDGETIWYTVAAWDRLGANAALSLHKGQPVIVQGVARTSEWTGRDGAVRSQLELRASAIGHDLNAGIASFTKASARAAAPAAPVEQAVAREPAPAAIGWSAPGAVDEDIPF